MTLKSKPSIVDSLIKGLELLDLRESLRDDFSAQNYLPILKDRSVLNKFGTLTAQQLHQILSGSDSLSTTKWTQHFYGNITNSRVKLATFVKQQGSPNDGAKLPEAHMFYTNYRVLTELAGKPADHTGTIILVPTDGVTLAYIRTDPEPNTLISRRPSGKYSFFVSTKTPQVHEGRLIKNYSVSNYAFIRNAACDRLAAFCTPQEKAILESYKEANTATPVLQDSITFSLVDTLNLISGSTTIGSGKQAGNALLGHNYLTHNSFDQSTLFSMRPELQDDIVKSLQQIVSFSPPFVNNWAPESSIFDEAEKKNKSAPSTFRKMINIFFSSFGNIYSSLNKSVGATSSDSFDLRPYIASGMSSDSRIQLTVSQLMSGTIYDLPPETKELKNAFLRLIWRYNDSGNPWEDYYYIGLEIVSLYPEQDKNFLSFSTAPSVQDKKNARLPAAAALYFRPNPFDPGKYISTFTAAANTVNAGQEALLRAILQSKLEAKGLFDTKPEILFSGIPRILAQLTAKQLKVLPVDLRSVLSDSLVGEINDYAGIKDLSTKPSPTSPTGQSDPLYAAVREVLAVVSGVLQTKRINPEEDISFDDLVESTTARVYSNSVFQSRLAKDTVLKVKDLINLKVFAALVPAEDVVRNFLTYMYSDSNSLLSLTKSKEFTVLTTILDNAQVGLWAGSSSEHHSKLFQKNLMNGMELNKDALSSVFTEDERLKNAGTP